MIDELNIGDIAPQFSLLNHENKKILLSDFKGKWVIVYFYPKNNTPGCTIESIGFSNYSKEFGNLNSIIFGVSADSVESHVKFRERNKLNIMLLSDPNKEVIKGYNSLGKRFLFGKDLEGVMRNTFLINPEGKIVYIWKKVNVLGHVDNVLKKLKELQK